MALTTNLDWLVRNDDLASAAATLVISSSYSVLVNTCSNSSSSSELESAATGAAVEGAGSEKTIVFFSGVEAGVGTACRDGCSSGFLPDVPAKLRLSRFCQLFQCHTWWRCA